MERDTSDHVMDSMNLSATLSSLTGHESIEVDVHDPVYSEVKQDLAKAGQTITRMFHITNNQLAQLFNFDAEFLMRFKPPGIYLCMTFICSKTQNK